MSEPHRMRFNITWLNHLSHSPTSEKSSSWSITLALGLMALISILMSEVELNEFDWNLFYLWVCSKYQPPTCQIPLFSLFPFLSKRGKRWFRCLVRRIEWGKHFSKFWAFSTEFVYLKWLGGIQFNSFLLT